MDSDSTQTGSSDEEFIDVQEKKREWLSKRNNSGKTQIVKDKGGNVKNQKARGVRDDYWGEDDNDFESVQQEGQFCERDSDDEGPSNPSDDDENIEVDEKYKWPFYDPETPYGSVQLELGQLFEKVEVLRKALIYYSCQTERTWNYCHNEPKRVLVKCKLYPKCSWKLSARYTKEYGCLQIRFFKDIHNCTPTKVNK
ncbi:hypothetical protein BVRB_8g186090 [Beta vulgaris subsp. vulgaris]|nr:hypothetical protein BVRB_8g186090 [Beta vulgaris subsp. vulgaris]